MPEWTFLTNHALILGCLARHPRITAREISVEIGITERAIRKIIVDLENDGYILKTREGRRVRFSVNPGLPLRHETQRDKAIGELLELLGWKSNAARRKKG